MTDIKYTNVSPVVVGTNKEFKWAGENKKTEICWVITDNPAAELLKQYNENEAFRKELRANKIVFKKSDVHDNMYLVYSSTDPENRAANIASIQNFKRIYESYYPVQEVSMEEVEDSERKVSMDAAAQGEPAGREPTPVRVMTPPAPEDDVNLHPNNEENAIDMDANVGHLRHPASHMEETAVDDMMADIKLFGFGKDEEKKKDSKAKDEQPRSDTPPAFGGGRT